MRLKPPPPASPCQLRSNPIHNTNYGCNGFVTAASCPPTAFQTGVCQNRAHKDQRVDFAALSENK